VQRKREPNNWGIIRVRPLLPYAAGKTQVSSHPFGDFMGTHLGHTILLITCCVVGIDWWHGLLFFCVCVHVFFSLSLSLSSFFTLDVVFLSFLLEACTLFCMC
jgi:hypothetical protein